MAIESIPIYSLLRSVFRWLPAFFFKRHYTPERLAQLIYCDLQPRGDSVSLDLGQTSTARLALQVINLSPFPVEIDRAKIQLVAGGATVNLSYLTRRIIASGEIASLFFEESIADGSANVIANSTEARLRAWLSGNIEFNCSVRNFAKNLGALSEIYPSVVNASPRKKSA